MKAVAQIDTAHSWRSRPLAAALLCVLVVAGTAGVGGMSGCYRRVTGAKGIGADRYEISEPYQKDTRVDRWFYGTESRRGGSRLP